MSRHDHPNPSASPVQKLRVRYAKRGRLRYTSHRDLARAFERSLRRAGVPMAQSQGFSPHPKVSWSGAVPTGVASEAEYVELQLVDRIAPEVLHAELDAVLPSGFDVLEVVEVSSGALADQLTASRWLMVVRGIGVDRLRDAVGRLLAAEIVEVERMTKNGRRSLDARAALVSAEAHAIPETITFSGQLASSIAHVDDWPKGSEPYGILETVVRQTTPVVRPDDVLSALRVVADLAPSVVGKATRLEQGRLDDAGGLTDPFALDRATAETRRVEPAVG